jgi:hypothetical protein
MFEGGRSFAIRFIETLKVGQFEPLCTQKPCPAGRKGVEFYTIGLGGC